MAGVLILVPHQVEYLARRDLLPDEFGSEQATEDAGDIVPAPVDHGAGRQQHPVMGDAVRDGERHVRRPKAAVCRAEEPEVRVLRVVGQRGAEELLLLIAEIRHRPEQDGQHGHQPDLHHGGGREPAKAVCPQHGVVREGVLEARDPSAIDRADHLRLEPEEWRGQCRRPTLACFIDELRPLALAGEHFLGDAGGFLLGFDLREARLEVDLQLVEEHQRPEEGLGELRGAAKHVHHLAPVALDFAELVHGGGADGVAFAGGPCHCAGRVLLVLREELPHELDVRAVAQDAVGDHLLDERLVALALAAHHVPRRHRRLETFP